MAYRIHIEARSDGLVLVFEGLLDPAALADIRETVARATAPVRLHLRAGAEVEPTCLEALRGMCAALSAESSFMAQLLADDPSCSAAPTKQKP